MMKPIREQLSVLKHAIDLSDYQQTSRDPSFSNGGMISLEKVLRRGISDLDFDPYYFLGTGNTSADGWATKN